MANQNQFILIHQLCTGQMGGVLGCFSDKVKVSDPLIISTENHKQAGPELCQSQV